MDVRSLILDRAMGLFAARGYDGVGVQEIVEAAGVTKPTLYHYFGSKQGLLKAVLATRAAELDAVLAHAAAYNRDLPLTLRRVVTAYVDFAHRNPVFMRLVLSLFFSPPESEGHRGVAALNDRQFAAMRDLFVKAAKDHGNMRGRHMLYAASFLGMINNCIGLGLNGYLALDAAIVERSVHQFEHGIYS
jgi:AcrR family transcriptional regulator